MDVVKLHAQGAVAAVLVVAGCAVAAWLAAPGPVRAAAAAGTGEAAARPGSPAAARAHARAGALHVPSPDWRDQVIYFVVTDRFADGDPRNNDQGAGEYGPGQRNRYNGGDFKGLAQRLDYIRGLGATAVWVTPPVANQWLNPSGDYAGYHGYWAEHFKRVDPHLGTLSDYRALSRALHARGMYLVQDIVVNHTGNFYTYRDRWRAGEPAHGFEPHDRSPPVPRPSQPPFDRNDPRDPAQRALGVYHWTPDVADYTDRQQELNFQMAGLDDLNTENPLVRRALRESYAFWIREAGVDAFRVDTAFYVPEAFFEDFLRARDPAAPGVLRAAAATGRHGFHVFGEGFAIDRPFADVQARKIESYMAGPDGRPLLPGMLNFPLYGALGEVLARGAPTAQLAHRITATMRLHARPHLMPTFVDNHDVDRFLAGGSAGALRQALLALFTLPGIPVVYYGTEQGFTEPRAAMFAAGWASGGRDRYDTTAPLYRTIAALAQLRHTHRVFSRGTPEVLRANEAGPGVLAWRMQAATGPAERTMKGARTALVVLNSAEHPVLLDRLETGLPPGTRLRGELAVERLGGAGPAQHPPELVVGKGGFVNLELPPRAGWVWTVRTGPHDARARATPAAPTPASSLTLEPLGGERVAGDFEVRGQVAGARAPRLVIDGDLAASVPVTPGPDGRFAQRVDTSRMIDPAVRHRLVLWDPASATSSEASTFTVQRAWTLAAEVEDPAGDDHGPRGTYRYPTDPSWGDNRQMDLRRVRAEVAGGALRLTLGMHRVSTSWSPANGFDHVAFTVYVELPGQGAGSTVMPLQRATLPEGMRWHRRLRVHGWSNALFSADGASADAEGTPVTPGAHVSADRERHTVTLTLPAAALGGLPSLAGARVYVTTWDYDGGYRALQPEAAPFAMGGGDPARDARVMDDSRVIVLP
jgi:glycosidase